MVVASAPGSGSDVIGRLLAVRLTENFGQQVVVDNRPGASGLIGAEVFLRKESERLGKLLKDAGVGPAQ